ncbi:MAG: hypothetical protein V3T35_07965 [Spirochaetia bacterium]
MDLSEEKRRVYEKKLLEAMKGEGDKKLRCDYLANKLSISKDYVLQLMISLNKQGLVHLELAKKAPEKKSWARLV